jgi:hypothetical protein
MQVHISRSRTPIEDQNGRDKRKKAIKITNKEILEIIFKYR